MRLREPAGHVPRHSLLRSVRASKEGIIAPQRRHPSKPPPQIKSWDGGTLWIQLGNAWSWRTRSGRTVPLGRAREKAPRPSTSAAFCCFARALSAATRWATKRRLARSVMGPSSPAAGAGVEEAAASAASWAAAATAAVESGGGGGAGATGASTSKHGRHGWVAKADMHFQLLRVVSVQCIHLTLLRNLRRW